MHRAHSRFATFGLLALAAAVQPACKDRQLQAARESSEREARGHLLQAREGLARLTSTYVPLMEALAPAVAAPVRANSEGNVRFELLGLGTRQTGAGSLTMFPTGFVAAVRPDGTAIARDIAEPDDLMRGLPLATLFPPVRGALDGNAGLGLGSLPATSDQPSRMFLVAAAPVRDPQGVAGALASGISFGRLALSLERAVRVRAGQQPVIWVGLHNDGRVYPSGRDRDVAERWLVPQALIRQIPTDWESRLERGNGQFSWNFAEGTIGWGAAMGTLPQLPGTRVVIFRSGGLTR